MHRGKPLSHDEQMVAVLARYEGASMMDIALTLDRDVETIRHCVRQFGLGGRSKKSTPRRGTLVPILQTWMDMHDE